MTGRWTGPAAVLGCLLLLAGLLPPKGGGPRGGAIPGPVEASAAAPVVAAAAPVAGPVVRLVERAAAELDRASPGPGDPLAVGPAAGVRPVLPSGPASPEGTVATPPGAPGTAFGARAPPTP